jgi:hypothetical protein
VQAACCLAVVSSSAYYDSEAPKACGPGEADWDKPCSISEIIDVDVNLDNGYGSPRVTGERRDRGFRVNHKGAERPMADNGLCAKDGRRRRLRTTIPDVCPAATRPGPR